MQLNYSFQSSRLLHAIPSRLLTMLGAFFFVIENTLFALYEFLTRSLWVFRCDGDLTTVKSGTTLIGLLFGLDERYSQERNRTSDRKGFNFDNHENSIA